MNGDAGERRRRLVRIGDSRPDVQADLDAELQFHFQEVVDALTEAGCSLEEAEAEGHRRCRDINRRRGQLLRIGRWRRRKIAIRAIGGAIANTLGWAFRGIRRRPGFSAVIIGTLALGIGANTLMFGVVDRLLLSPPLHIVDADQVRHLYLERTENSGRVAWRRFTYPDYQSLHRVREFSQLAAYRDRERLPVGVGEDVRQAYIVQAAAALFPLLGVRPLFGRFFSEEDDVEGAVRTAVLSEEFWVRRFGRDPAVLGRVVSIGRWEGTALYEVIGVAPAGFTGAELDRVDLWIPLSPELGRQAQEWEDWILNIVVRLQEGAPPETASHRATAVHRAVRTAWAEETGVDWYDPEARVFTSSVIAARGPNPSAVSSVAKWLAALSVIVLIVACTNVTNLLLANNIRLRQELAIRAAIGAGPVQAAVQLLTQIAVLATLGCVAGLAVWFTLAPIIHAAVIPTVSYPGSHMVPRVLVFAGIAALFTILGAGAVPALQTRRLVDFSSLRTGCRGNTATSTRLRHLLVAIQTTLSVLLLIGAGLFVMSLRRAKEFDLGISAVGVVEVELEFRVGVGSLRRREIYKQVLDRIRVLPGVHSAATYAGSRPLEGGMNYQLRIPDRDPVPAMPGGWPHYFQGSVDFLDVYGFRLIRGRAPEASDVLPGAEPVMLISTRTDRMLWPDGRSLNRCAIVVGDETPTGAVEPCRRIIGVFDDVVVRRLDELPSFAFFIPIGEVDFWMPWGIAVRANDMSAALVERVRAAASDVSPDVYFADVRTMSERVDQKLKHWLLGVQLFTVFGVLALVMACSGLYSVLTFDVAQRRRELGIRSALGAQSSQLVKTVLWNAMIYVLGGILVGTGIAFVAGRLLERLLFETTSSDPSVYAVVVVTLLLSGFAAGLIPSVRAASSDPMEVMRTE